VASYPYLVAERGAHLGLTSSSARFPHPGTHNVLWDMAFTVERAKGSFGLPVVGSAFDRCRRLDARDMRRSE
jgi:hypothetical protein